VGEYRVGFFSEPDEADSPHVHVTSGKGAAKFWLNPVSLARNDGFNERELAKARRAVKANERWLLSEYQKHHGAL
jgi:hypothetical protein